MSLESRPIDPQAVVLTRARVPTNPIQLDTGSGHHAHAQRERDDHGRHGHHHPPLLRAAGHRRRLAAGPRHDGEHGQAEAGEEAEDDERHVGAVQQGRRGQRGARLPLLAGEVDEQHERGGRGEEADGLHGLAHALGLRVLLLVAARILLVARRLDVDRVAGRGRRRARRCGSRRRSRFWCCRRRRRRRSRGRLRLRGRPPAELRVVVLAQQAGPVVEGAGEAEHADDEAAVAVVAARILLVARRLDVDRVAGRGRRRARRCSSRRRSRFWCCRRRRRRSGGRLRLRGRPPAELRVVVLAQQAGPVVEGAGEAEHAGDEAAVAVGGGSEGGRELVEEIHELQCSLRHTSPLHFTVPTALPLPLISCLATHLFMETPMPDHMHARMDMDMERPVYLHFVVVGFLDD
jgi:hypothetical protein